MIKLQKGTEIRDLKKSKKKEKKVKKEKKSKKSTEKETKNLYEEIVTPKEPVKDFVPPKSLIQNSSLKVVRIFIYFIMV